jgi:hypothetical protein
MKHILTLFLCMLASCLYAQNSDLNFYIGFDNNNYKNYRDNNHPPKYSTFQDSIYIKIDTSLPRNKWQIGHPGKVNFTSAYSGTKAIVTDTAFMCNSGDTSIFTWTILKNAWSGFSNLSFIYKLDIDTGDIAIIQRSGDTGRHWINFLNDTIFSFPIKPNFITSTTSWDSVVAYPALPFFYTTPNNDIGNFIFRFTFIPGVSTKVRDGWMIDNFRFNYIGEGVNEINKNVTVSVSPNPANTDIVIKYALAQKNDLTIQISNALGQLIKEVKIPNTSSGFAKIPVDMLPMGMYYYIIKTETSQAAGKIMIGH